MDAKIVEKIKKLDALATKNASEGERNNALAAMQKLLDEHNLSLDQIRTEAVDPFASKSQVFHEIKLEKWTEAVLFGLCEAFDCIILIRKVGKYTKNNTVTSYNCPNIIGTIDNIATVRYMFDYVTASIKKEAKAYSENAMLTVNPRNATEAYQMMMQRPELLNKTEKNKRQAYRSFCLGAAVELIKRAQLMKLMKEQRDRQAQQQPQNSTPGTALARIHDQMKQNNTKVLEQEVGPKPQVKKSRTVKIQQNAFIQGARHGAKLNLSKQISSTGKDTQTKAIPHNL